MWVTVYASVFGTCAGMSRSEFIIVELIKGGFCVGLEQDSSSYSEPALRGFNSCAPVFPMDCSICAGCSDKVFLLPLSEFNSNH